MSNNQSQQSSSELESSQGNNSSPPKNLPDKSAPENPPATPVELRTNAAIFDSCRGNNQNAPENLPATPLHKRTVSRNDSQYS
ncbi:MAG: hypothetical protein AB4080_17630 [Trichodesmium sp.]